MIIYAFLYVLPVCACCCRLNILSYSGRLSPQPCTSTTVAVLAPADLWPPVMIPCRGDDDCTDCSVWSVTRQNRLSSSKRLSVSVPLTFLSLCPASICTFIATRLLLTQAIRSYWGAGMVIFDNKHTLVGAVWDRKHTHFYAMWEDFEGIVWVCGSKAPKSLKSEVWYYGFLAFFVHSSELQLRLHFIAECVSVCVPSSTVSQVCLGAPHFRGQEFKGQIPPLNFSTGPNLF